MTRLPTPAHRLPAVWPACVGALAVLFALTGDGDPTRRSVIAWMMGAWGARLTVQSLYTGIAATSSTSGPFTLPLLTSYFRLLTFSVAFSIPALLAARNPDPSLSVLEIGAAALWILAFAGETTADRQWLRFASRPDHAGLACRTGLWRLLPRAHVFFELLIWTAFALFALASPWGWVALACPAAMLHLLTRRY